MRNYKILNNKYSAKQLYMLFTIKLGRKLNQTNQGEFFKLKCKKECNLGSWKKTYPQRIENKK